MPPFSFDDTKFYALTHMINVLSRRNREENREIWNHRGFNPEMAYEIYCSNCHGAYLQGDGPTGQWIYPIPKNLRNATFLRNLTKARAIDSITHGVLGTPMPPWGEAAPHKGFDKEDPVLRPEEVAQLVDWLYLALPGAEVIRASEVQKWQYSPEDFLEELKKEGGAPKKKESEEIKTSALDLLPNGEGLFAAMEPKVYTKGLAESDELRVSDLFDVAAPLHEGPDKHAYYIKKKYYTTQNLKEGENFFVMNCAVCHGKEAGGNGERAETMSEAKPRMLTNLNWLRFRDDLRLLRSIKYGVPGTGMTPWGDLTTAKQRMQLVMFIRHLSRDGELRTDLSDALFKSFEEPSMMIEQKRMHDYASIEKLQAEYDKTRQERVALYEQAEKEGVLAPSAAEIYQKELKLLAELKKSEESDALLVSLMAQLQKEKEIYKGIGLSLIDKKAAEDIVKAFFQLTDHNQGRFEMKGDDLVMNLGPDQVKQIKTAEDTIGACLDARLEYLNKKLLILKGQLPTPERNEELKAVEDEETGMTKVKSALYSGIESAAKLRKLETDLYQEYMSKKNSEK